VDVTLDVEQKREVNFTLVLKGVATQVEVAATAAALNTTTGTIGGRVEGRQVANLPLNGRDIQNLMLMQPGQQFENNVVSRFATNTSGNGNRGLTGSSFLDGMDTSDNEVGGGLFGNFNLDAIAEFRLLQNNYSAEYGRGSGTIISVVSKTGTNDLHGSAFEFVRNDKFDARNFAISLLPAWLPSAATSMVSPPVGRSGFRSCTTEGTKHSGSLSTLVTASGWLRR
jgi:hypothetical protein